jgi:hypothetical protein
MQTRAPSRNLNQKISARLRHISVRNCSRRFLARRASALRRYPSVRPFVASAKFIYCTLCANRLASCRNRTCADQLRLSPDRPHARPTCQLAVSSCCCSTGCTPTDGAGRPRSSCSAAVRQVPVRWRRCCEPSTASIGPRPPQCVLIRQICARK